MKECDNKYIMVNGQYKDLPKNFPVPSKGDMIYFKDDTLVVTHVDYHLTKDEELFSIVVNAIYWKDQKKEWFCYTALQGGWIKRSCLENQCELCSSTQKG